MGATLSSSSYTLSTNLLDVIAWAIYLLFGFLLVALIVWSVRRAIKDHNWLAGWRGFGAIAGLALVWGVAFAEPWVYVLLPTVGKAVLVIAWLVFLLAAAIVAARRLPYGLSALYDAFLLMGTPWSLTWGTYVAHDVGWHGLRFEDLGTREMGAGAEFWAAILLTVPLLIFGAMFGLVAGLRAEKTWPPPPKGTAAL